MKAPEHPGPTEEGKARCGNDTLPPEEEGSSGQPAKPASSSSEKFPGPLLPLLKRPLVHISVKCQYLKDQEEVAGEDWVENPTWNTVLCLTLRYKLWCTWPTLTAVGWRGLTLQGSLLRPSEQTRHQVKGTGTAFSEKCRCNAVETLPKKLAMPRGTCTNSLSAHPESRRGVLRPGKWWRPDYPRQSTKDLSFGQFWC